MQHHISQCLAAISLAGMFVFGCSVSSGEDEKPGTTSVTPIQSDTITLGTPVMFSGSVPKSDGTFIGGAYILKKKYKINLPSPGTLSIKESALVISCANDGKISDMTYDFVDINGNIQVVRTKDTSMKFDVFAAGEQEVVISVFSDVACTVDALNFTAEHKPSA